MLLGVFGRPPIAFLNERNAGIAGHRHHDDLVVPRPADDAVPRRAAAGSARTLRGRGAGQRRPLDDLVAASRCRRSGARSIVVIIIEIVLQFQLFGQAQLMTLGGPNNASRPIVLFIYEVGFNRWDIGYAAAAAQILFAMILSPRWRSTVSRGAGRSRRERAGEPLVVRCWRIASCSPLPSCCGVLMLVPIAWVLALSLQVQRGTAGGHEFRAARTLHAGELRRHLRRLGRVPLGPEQHDRGARHDGGRARRCPRWPATALRGSSFPARRSCSSSCCSASPSRSRP